ncbi:hypothetical protein GIB67_025138 [Kingdonia uniflora]|uniref:Uncharacterized protein n=1 Tax=Kingdonia uniflora TaxID=39325 RepID=A0A7J7N8B0_9MAGN|nr:hypothetical protein GIB67_025138 [Kingdonia uniflora]
MIFLIRAAMDTSETKASTALHGVANRKIKKGVQVRRTKSIKKMKALEKAISRSEKSAEKVVKSGKKTSRTQSAKKLYE